MRKVLPLLLLLCLLTGCTSATRMADLATPYQGDQAPSPRFDEPPQAERAATLWFRFLDEPLLAPEDRVLPQRPDQTYEMALLTALLSGPSLSETELRTPFPTGTRVLSATRQGSVCFVTLSRHILGAFADEPEDWASDPLYAREVPLRRTLAMQAIAATLTENTDAEAVVILVHQPDMLTDSMRLRTSYYRRDASDALAPALTRDESLLLTPSGTLSTILTCVTEADWSRLIRYVPDAPEDFVSIARSWPALTRWTLSGGSVTDSRATFTVSGQRDGIAFSEVVHLYRAGGLWRVSMAEMIDLMEVSQ